MTTMLSLILAFMLSIGGSPAASVNPAGCPGDTGIQTPIDNNRAINHFSEDYNQKTASRANSKKTGENPSIKGLETVNSIRFSRFSIEKLRQARYFNHRSYRFNSVDPIINRVAALSNPQLWNLYAYCRNNPITFMDTDGRRESIGDEYFRARERILRQYGPKAAEEFEAGYKAGMVISIAVAAAVAIPFIENEHCHSKPKKTKTVDDLIDSRDPHTTKGRSKMYDMEGGFDQANKDFDSLNPNNVRSYGDGKRVGVLKDGRKVIVRKDSEDGRPTLEIQKGKNKTKFRYNDK